jgi:hypothetical protein
MVSRWRSKPYRPTPRRRGASRPSSRARTSPRRRRRKSLVGRQEASGGRNSGAHHGPVPGRRAQAGLPRHRFQARQGRRAGQGGGHRVRSEPLGPHRAAATTPTARSATSCSRWARSGHDRDVRSRGRHPGGQRAAAQEHPAGTVVHNIELRPGKGAQMARSAGTQAQLVSREGEYALLKLPSGEVRRVPVECMATVGQVGNLDHENVTLGKAGRTRWLGRRPHNRGVSMNPVDHPHGGGEGKTSGGRHPVTPWGQPTRGFKTRNNKRTDKWIVTARKKRSGSRERGKELSMGRSLKKGPFTDDHLVEEGGGAEREEREEGGPHLVAPLDDPAGVHRPHHRGAQRQEVHPGVRHREHGGPQAGRVLADADLQGHVAKEKSGKGLGRA